MRQNIPARVEITCDRCKTPVDDKRLSFGTIYHEELDYHGVYNAKVIDLCLGCVRDFIKFMHEQP